ncbi:MAG: glycyl-radical enzyme activating protein [Prolixibacteraceae bacterium]|nr:glycyl-radical enzyme activating protein [Prolixibacteraceae bacterium]MBN2773729.1 glycyl-radical enzyme activating protein [Prolixibacteraceae bacterium]
MGVVFDIKRFAVHDGPGIRITIFLKGCPLSCWWCHNPESISAAPQKVKKQLKLNGKVYTEEETVGKEVGVSEVMQEVARERIVMEESGGGVTFSGGEPMLQSDFLLDLLMASKKEGYHTSVDTSGLARQEDFEKIIPFTDLFLFDLKIMNEELHKKYTGVSNRKILDNLKFLSDNKKTIRIRIPVVKDVNDSEENISQTIFFLKTLKGIEQVDLLPYHHIGKSKYERFGLKYKMPDQIETSDEEIQAIKSKFENEGFKTKIGG